MRSISRGFILSSAVFILGTVLHHLFNAAGIQIGERPPGWGFVAAGLLAFGAGLGAAFNREWRKFATSVRFAVPVIFTVTALSILGTLIIQRQPEPALRVAYGSALALIQALFLDDIFHSFGFSMLLGLSGAGLALAVIRKRKINPRYLGVLAAHLGLLLVLLGAAVGNIGLVKGRLNLHVGRTADSIFLDVTDGKAIEYPLGFEVRLDEFKLLHYEPEFRLAVYRVAGGEPQRLATADPRAEEKRELAAFGVEVLGYWPDYTRETAVTPVTEDSSDGSPAPAGLELEGKGASGQESFWLFDEGSGSGGRLTQPGASLAFFWDIKRANGFLESQVASSKARPHTIVSGGTEMPVEVGNTYPVPGTDYRIEVVRAFKDFVIDQDDREPRNRSDDPRNPAIEVKIADSAGKVVARNWLFANFPDFHGQAGRLPIAGLGYRYTGANAGPRVDMIAVGEAGEIWRLKEGVVESREELKAGEALKLGDALFSVRSVHSSVRTSIRHATLTDKANNPVVQLSVRGEAEPRFLNPAHPVRLDDQRVVVLENKGGETVRDYLSTLSVLEKGRPVLTRTIEVNHPLEYEGFAFFQADYRPDDLTFSGFQVVRDPGLWIVYLGFLVNVLGVMLALYLPRSKARNKADKGVKGEGR